MKSIVLVLSIFCAFGSYSQLDLPGSRTLGSAYVDTVYFPFYNGSQMILMYKKYNEARHFDIDIRDQSMAIPYSAYSQIYQPDYVYLFRNRKGKIIKSFNTHKPLDSLNKRFESVPIDRMNKSTDGTKFYATHKSISDVISIGNDDPHMETASKGFYIVKQSSDLVWSGELHASPISAKLGVIDSMGNFILKPNYDVVQPVNDKFIVSQKSEIGVFSNSGKLVLPFEYERFETLISRDIAFFKNEKYVLVLYRAENRFIELDEYDKIGIYSSYAYTQCIPVKKGHKWGFMDKSFKETTPPTYDFMEFNPTLREPQPVLKNDKWGYVDMFGKEVISCIYDHAEPFKSQAHTNVYLKGENFCIDRNGNRVEECKGEPDWQLNYIRSGYQLAKSKRFRNRFGVITDSGEVVVPIAYEAIFPGYRGKYINVKMGGKFGIMDTNFNIVFPCEFHAPPQFSTNHALVTKDNKMGLVNDKLELVIPTMYDQLGFAQYNRILFRLDGKQGIMDTLGNIVIENVYDGLGTFDENGLGVVYNDNLYGVINASGKIIVPIKYEQLSGFCSGLSRVLIDGKYGFMNMKGRIVIKPTFDKATIFREEIAAVKKGDKWSLINTNGRSMTGFIYDEMNFYTFYDYTKVAKDGKYGIYNGEGKLIIPCEYDTINILRNTHYLFEAFKNEQRILMDSKGRKSS